MACVLTRGRYSPEPRQDIYYMIYVIEMDCVYSARVLPCNFFQFKLQKVLRNMYNLMQYRALIDLPRRHGRFGYFEEKLKGDLL